MHDGEHMGHPGREEDVLKTNTKEDDVLDMLRYLCMGYKYHVERMPPGEYVAEKLNEYLQRDPTLAPALQFEIKRNMHEQYQELYGKGPVAFSVGRGSAGMRGLWTV